MTMIGMTGLPVFTLPDVRTVGDIWCVYRHQYPSVDGQPPVILYINACRLTDVFEMNEARNNSDWATVYANGGAIMLEILSVHATAGEAQSTAHRLIKSMNPFPRCNLHGYNMHRSARPILCSNGVTYKTQSEAASALRINQGNLSKHLREPDVLKSVGGYTFKYVESGR